MVPKERGKDVIRIGKNILTEDALEFQVQYKGDVFTLRYPTPAVMAAISSEVARRLNGYPQESFSREHIESVNAYATIDFIWVEGKCPEWFKGPWTCYDEELVANLYQGYLLFRNQFQTRLREDRFSENS